MILPLEDYRKIARGLRGTEACAAIVGLISEVESLRAALQSARGEALESAAEIADGAVRRFDDPSSEDGFGEEQWDIDEIAAAIRSLKTVGR